MRSPPRRATDPRDLKDHRHHEANARGRRRQIRRRATVEIQNQRVPSPRSDSRRLR